MDLNIFVELISNFGLPIALIVAMGWFIFKIYKQSVERETTLMAEIKENREINAEAINTIAHYAEKLDGIQEDIKEIKTDLIVIKNK